MMGAVHECGMTVDILWCGGKERAGVGVQEEWPHSTVKNHPRSVIERGGVNDRQGPAAKGL